jgi:multiple sugar transport system ATP-binding protein
MACVVLEQLTRIFQGDRGESIRALERIDLTVQDKELLVVVGPSGCGKTTLLRLIAGLEEPSSGTITMDGALLNGVKPKERDIAMVFQNPALYPHMSANENMAFGLKLRKHSRTEIDRRVSEAAELLGLTRFLKRKPMELSGGQRQRVALGRAIVRRPKLFLFDEPLSNLDPPLRNQMRIEISKLHKRLGATIIYVTHDQVEAMTLGDRVAVLNQGRIHQVNAPLGLYDSPIDLFVAGFIGSPSMNFFEGSLKRAGNDIIFSIDKHCQEGVMGEMRVHADEATGIIAGNCLDRKVILGLRPEHIEPHRLNCDSRPEHIASATVESIERVGPESHLRLTTRGGHAFIARAAADFPTTAGQKLDVEFKMRHAHFFDPVSGRRFT